MKPQIDHNALLSMYRNMPHDANNYYYAERRRNDRKKKQTLILWVGLVGAMGIWFLTPFSEYFTSFLLEYVPMESDIDMGLQAWDSMKRTYRQVPDVWHVKDIGQELVRLLPRAHQKNLFWDFGVIHSNDVINAFALPGGIVRVTDRLLKKLDLSDGELAALIGHEMGHVIHRHSQARMLQQELVGYLIRAFTYEDHDSHQETFGEAIGELLLQSAAAVGTLKFSRKDEYEADATSWDLLMQSNKYSPQAAQSLLQKLWDASGGSGETSWESTHPGTKDRIGALQDKWRALPPSQRQKLVGLVR